MTLLPRVDSVYKVYENLHNSSVLITPRKLHFDGKGVLNFTSSSQRFCSFRHTVLSITVSRRLKVTRGEFQNLWTGSFLYRIQLTRLWLRSNSKTLFYVILIDNLSSEGQSFQPNQQLVDHLAPEFSINMISYCIWNVMCYD